MVKKVWWNPKCIFYSSQKEKPAHTAVIQSLLLCKTPYGAVIVLNLNSTSLWFANLSAKERIKVLIMFHASALFIYFQCVSHLKHFPLLCMCVFFFKYLRFLSSDSFAVLPFMSDQTSHARRVNLARAHRKLGTWNVTLWLCRLGCTNVTEPGAS